MCHSLTQLVSQIILMHDISLLWPLRLIHVPKGDIRHMEWPT